MRIIKSLIDDNYVYSSERMGFLYESLYINKNFSFFKGIIRFGYCFYRSLKHTTLKIFFIKKRSGIALIGSYNNYETIKPFMNEMELNVVSFLKKYDKTTIFPLFYVYVLSVLTFPVTILLFVYGSRYVKTSFKYCLNEYVLIPPLRIYYWFLFVVVKPKFIIIVNDHICYFRSAVKVAKSLSIKTFYIQHASVTEKFPSLFTDVAFLDGEDSKQKYLSHTKATTCKIYLTGSSKYDALWHIHKPINKIINIGIATNEYDSLEIVETLINSLKNKFIIYLRSHPADKRFLKWEQMAKNNHVNWSSSHEESVFDFLKSVDSIIAYNSSILLESMITGRPSFSFQLSHEEFDHYGFQKQKLIKHYKDINLLTDSIESGRWECDFTKCKFYYELYGDKDAGESTKNIISLIKKEILCK
ncbi:MAG: hypothetical protein WC002_10045 [Candidatus Muiribacteriota bacterium]